MPKLFEYVQQLKHLKVDINDIPDILEKHDSAKKFMYIIHDKDTKPDGTSVEPHLHLLVNCGKTSVQFKDVAKWFNDEPQHFGYIKCGKWDRAALYLIHGGNSDKDKHQYDISEIKANYDFNKDIEKAKKNEDNKLKYLDLQTYCEKVITGEILPNCPEKYLSDFDCINDKGLIKKAYNERVRRMINEMKYNKSKNVNVVFITGESGSGKDVMATELASQWGDGSYVVSSSSNDTMQDYCGENTLILSDLRDDDFKFADLLKILDNHLPSSMKSRYNNKFFIGENIIITSKVDLCDWYKSNFHSDDDNNQLYRRIKTYVKIDKNKGVIKQYEVISTDEYHKKYLFDDNVECLNFFPPAYKSRCEFYYKLLYTSPYNQLEQLIALRSAINDKNVINLCDALSKSLGYLKQDVENIKTNLQK